MTPHDDENDKRPAWGLRDDAFDDGLRANSPRPKKPAEKPSDDSNALDAAASVDAPDDDPPRRGRGPARLTDLPKGAFLGSRMCQTETMMRTADSLAKRPQLITHDVCVFMSGYELIRREAKRFEVMATMSRWGYVREPGNYEEDSWNGFYAKKGQPRRLLLNFDRLNGHLLTRLVNGQRLVVVVNAGPLAPTRSSTESKHLSNTIGRITRSKITAPGDQFAIALPRTERFRKLVAESRDAEGVQRLGLLFFLVDRGGGFSGLPETIS